MPSNMSIANTYHQNLLLPLACSLPLLFSFPWLQMFVLPSRPSLALPLVAFLAISYTTPKKFLLSDNIIRRFPKKYTLVLAN
jgi:hypothetical protein